ncbi:MAG TPA: NAD-dependent epimerase/dehydratase family protein [Bryobacteraceae bacterium]|nr:NAD-dependent epimerase/dehydratase family protein [Bryobacteraceae bacterium]
MILVTGAAGFIGYHVAARLLADFENSGERVVGIDNLNSYYDPALKRARLKRLRANAEFAFGRIDVADREAMADVFEELQPSLVIHLAAQAGVRHSIDNPHEYTEANIEGFLNVLEGCRRVGVEHLIYASSSSVYGGHRQTPFRESDRVDQPVSLYAATKRANELMAHAYAHLFGFTATGLRFFTVYGPWGRPDMAPMKFARAIARGERIDVYGYGRMRRDFTFIDDAVECVARLAAAGGEGARIFNVGNDAPVELMEFIGELERAMGRCAHKRLLPMQAGDVESTHADVAELERAIGYRPGTSIGEGIGKFVGWYREHFGDCSEREAGIFRAS